MSVQYSDTKHSIPQLDKTGGNYWRWEQALKLYAQAHACDELLDGSLLEPQVTPHAPISSLTTADYLELLALAAAKATVVTNNETDKKRYDGELAARQQWRRADAALKLCILNTVPREIYESVVDLTTP
jgi:hypothetical protein